MEAKDLIQLLEDCKYPIEHMHRGNNDESELLAKISKAIESLSKTTPTKEIIEAYNLFRCDDKCSNHVTEFLESFSQTIHAKSVSDAEILEGAKEILPYNSEYDTTVFTMGAEWMRDRLSQPTEGERQEVYSRDECVFEYCPNPDHCKFKSKCQNPSDKK